MSIPDPLTLLKKYIEHVKRCDGCNYIDLAYRTPKDFTEEEWQLLHELAGSADDPQRLAEWREEWEVSGSDGL